MVDPKEIDTLSSELENRLDDLFSENDVQLPEPTGRRPEEQYPLAELKNLILSIDWEITDEVLENLLKQLEALQLTYKSDKIVMTFLQILNSLGKYIQSHRSKAHPKTFKILNSVFASLDKVVLAQDMPEPAKKKILRADMIRYKELRKQIAKSKKEPVKRKVKAKPVIPEAPKVPAKTEEPVLTLDTPTELPEVQQKSDTPVPAFDAPTGKPEISEISSEPVLTLDEPFEITEIEGKKVDSIITLGERVKGPLVADEDELPDTHQHPQSSPGVVTLADAVEEIKRFLHTEFNALKEEIRALRKQ